MEKKRKQATELIETINTTENTVNINECSEGKKTRYLKIFTLININVFLLLTNAVLIYLLVCTDL